MKRNMGRVDRAIRSMLGLGIIYAYAYDYIPGGIGIFLLVISAIFILTSVFAVCPLYYLFGISTCSNNKANE